MVINYTGTPLTRANPEDAGWDLTTLEEAVLNAHSFTPVRTGTRIMIPAGYYGRITHRSSVLKRGIEVQDGTIDAYYTGELIVMARLIDPCWAPVIVQPEERIAQIIFAPVVRPSLIRDDDLPVHGAKGFRGDRGWGSSGL